MTGLVDRFRRALDRQGDAEHGVDASSEASTPRRLRVAFSGGVDSTALLLLARAAAIAPLDALHVNHHMHADSNAWAEHCRRIGRDLDLPVHILDVPADPRPTSETTARTARYHRFRQCLERGDVLLLGHHRDDQIETALLNLLRGCSLAGAGGMPARRRIGDGELRRPLLDVTRDELRDHVRSAGVSWIEDPGNATLDADRNWLRHQVLPLLQQRWRAAPETLARSIRMIAGAHAALDTVIDEDLRTVTTDQGLIIAAWQRLPAPRQPEVLRGWLQRLGLASPDHRQLAELVRQAIHARDDAALLVCWPGVEVRRYRGVLYASSPLKAAPLDFQGRWQSRRLELPDDLGHLTWDRDLDGLWPSLTVRFRRGGERIAVRAGSGRRPLKKLLQEAQVPPWQRDRIPLVYGRVHGEDQLLAVGNLAGSPDWRELQHLLGAEARWQQCPAQ